MFAPYYYFNILALMAVLKYAGRRYIDINMLNRFYISVSRDIVRDIFIFEKKQTNLILDDSNDIKDFADRCSDICYLRNNTIYLKDNVTYEDLKKIEEGLFSKLKLSKYLRRTSYYLFSKETIDCLGINGMSDIINNYANVEKEIYDNYINDKGNSKANKLLLCKRLLFSYNIQNLPKEMLDGLWEALPFDFAYDENFIHEEEWNYFFKLDDKEEALFSDEEPIDEENEPPTYSKIYYDTFIYAIFGHGDLGYCKIEDLLFFTSYQKMGLSNYDSDKSFPFMNLKEKKKFDSKVYTQYVFYLQYIRRLDDLLLGKIYDDEEIDRIAIAKKRLFYALDDFGLYLNLDSQNYDKAYQETLRSNFKNANFSGATYLAFYFLDDVFSREKDAYTLRKLAFIGTYYDLTLNHDIILCLDDYSDCPHYELYKKIILEGMHKGYTKRKKK